MGRRVTGAVLVLTACAILLVGLAGCDTGGGNPEPTFVPPTGVPPAITPGTDIEAQVGKEFIITVASNPTTGYQWTMRGILEEGTVEVVDSQYIRTESDAQGGGGVEIWTFRAVKAGTATIMLEYSLHGDGTPDVGAPMSVGYFYIDIKE